jgi:hypothetical protein
MKYTHCINKSNNAKYEIKLFAFSEEYNGTVLTVNHCDIKEYHGKNKCINAGLNNQQNIDTPCHVLA